MRVSRRHFLAGSLVLPAFAAKKTPERPNVVLVVVDDLPAWVLGCYGSKEVRTPNIDRLAQSGTRFSNHVVCSPAAGLSRATLFTGRTSMQLGGASEVPASEITLDKILAGGGYASRTSDIQGAVKALDGGGKPFFLTVNVPGLKPPYDGVAQKYHDLYAQTRFDTVNPERVPASNAATGKEMLADTLGNLRRYAAAVTSLDDQMQPLISALWARKADETLIVVTGSCGALLSHHGLWGAGDASEPANMYEESVRTPMIWSWAGHVPAQGVRPEVVSSYDLVPTLCDLFGIEPPNRNLCGRSYAPLATGKPLPKKQPWRSTAFGHYRNTDMARAQRYKLVVHGGKGTGELYDLVADPAEKANHFDDPQFMTVRDSLSAEVSKWKQKYSS